MLSPSSTANVLTAPTFFGRPSPPTSPRLTIRPPPVFITAATSTAYAPTEEFTSPSYLSPRAVSSSLYDILGIPTEASDQEIKAAYRRLARICHPDVAALDRKDSSAYNFMKIHDAYSTLSDPEKRADYDRKSLRRYRPLTSATVSSGFSGYTSRNWETDQCW